MGEAPKTTVEEMEQKGDCCCLNPKLVVDVRELRVKAHVRGYETEKCDRKQIVSRVGII